VCSLSSAHCGLSLQFHLKVTPCQRNAENGHVIIFVSKIAMSIPFSFPVASSQNKHTPHGVLAVDRHQQDVLVFHQQSPL